jgi:hypothetical protein
MAKNAFLKLVLILSILVFSVITGGCHSIDSSPVQNLKDNSKDQSLVNQDTQALKREQAFRLASELSFPAQIALAGLGKHSTGFSNLNPDNANCESLPEKLAGFLSSNQPRQDLLNNDEVKISLTALELILSGQFLIDIQKLVRGVTHNVAVFPIELYSDIKKLETVQKDKNASLQNLRQELLNNINEVKINHSSCRHSISNYLKIKTGLIDQQCAPKISAPVLAKLRNLAVPDLAFNSANDIVKNDTAWTAVQIYSLIHGWTVTDSTRAALESAFAENPDLGPLVENGVDVLLKKENADTVISFLERAKAASKSCGAKEPIRLNDDTVVRFP